MQIDNSYPLFYEEVKRQQEIIQLVEDVRKLVETACDNCEHKNTNCSECFVDQFVNKYMR